MIQTHLLKLDPPYQIIACKGEVGMQIATLIVIEETRSEDGKYGITTHSHPVVTYEDKTLVRKRLEELPDNDDSWEDMALLLNGEGVVWDKVEVTDTLLVCMSDQKERKLRSYAPFQGDAASTSFQRAPRGSTFGLLDILGDEIAVMN